MIAAIWQWLFDPASWSGESGIGTRLLEHLTYTAVIMACTLVLALPLGLWVGHTGRGRWLVSVANSMRAIPTLGLLFAMTLWLGPKIQSDLAFVVPSVVVLVILAIPPVLSGTYSGIEAVDPAARDAAFGMGMRGPEVLRKVEVPCALPLVLSGVRAATLQVIATATISAYVGLGGLGRFLIDGLASGLYAVTAGGAILVAAVALLVDLLLAGLQRLVVSPGLTGKQQRARSVARTERSAPSSAPTSAPI